MRSVIWSESSRSPAGWRVLASAVAMAVIAGCGGGESAKVDTAASSSSRVQALSLPVGASCDDPSPGVVSNVVFAPLSASAASTAKLSSNGSTACFYGDVEVGVASTLPIRQGPDSFYYFEATRSDVAGVGMGVSAAPLEAPVGGEFTPAPHEVFARNGGAVTYAPEGFVYNPIGDQRVLGFAVDYRGRWPVVYVIGSSAVSGSPCAATGPEVPCVVARRQLQEGTGSLYIFGYGSALYSGVPRSVSINTGHDLAIKPYHYSQAAVRQALRTAWFQGDRGFQAQWPGAQGPLAFQAVTVEGTDAAVFRPGDRQPYTRRLKARAGTLTPSIVWTDPNGRVRATGGNLPIEGDTCPRCTPGRYTLIASVTDPATGFYSEQLYTVTVVARGSRTDDDDDGLDYDAEKAAGTDPAQADTDGDGLSDGVEAALGLSPVRADTDGNGTRDGQQLAGSASLPERMVLVRETGATPTSEGIVISSDGLKAAFTSDVNQDCAHQRGDFTEPLFADIEFCRKRAVRANAGVRPGEFRYFETRRLLGVTNTGHGLVSPLGQIDPFCCFTSLVAPTPPLERTPPSFQINSLGGMYVNLVLHLPFADYPEHSPEASEFYGFAVDYRGAQPVVYAITTSATGTMSVSSPFTLAGFDGLDIIPYLYGHPIDDAQPASSVNFGLTRFHYDTAQIRTRLSQLGVDTSAFVPGVGVHRRP